MTVAISLGLRFISIDSLCIIQDDGNDKAFEYGVCLRSTNVPG